MLYEVTVTEHISQSFQVEASSPQEAELKVKKMYEDEEIRVENGIAFNTDFDAVEVNDFWEGLI